MKIFQIIHGFPPYNTAGTEVYAYNLSKELAKSHKVFVFHRTKDLNIKEYSIVLSHLDGLEIFAINNTFRSYDSFDATYRNKLIAEKFGEILNQIKPDIVHVQHLLYLSTKIIEEAKKRRIPIVFTLHDYWLLCPQGQLLRNNEEICNRENHAQCAQCVSYQLAIKRNIIKAYYWLKRFMPEVLFQLSKNIYLNCCKFYFPVKSRATNLIKERDGYMKDICQKVDLFISPSQFLRKRFTEWGILEDKIITLTPGFNLDNFDNYRKTNSEKLRFGFIGNIMAAKGILLLIECFNKIDNEKVELRIYGKASSYKSIVRDYLAYIKKLVKNRNIKFMGGFDHKKIAGIFGEIDVLIVPSIWYENLPLVIQEAFAAKTPVIASNIGGIPELIVDGVNGILFKPNDINDLYRKINQVIENPYLIESMKQNISPPKSIEQNAKEVENIYEGLLNRC